MAREWFVAWFDSPYYHTLYQCRDEREARFFIDQLLKILALPEGARVLDLACGRGRHARYLAEKGFDVTGLDISENSIAYARQFEHDRLTFYQHDMRQPFRVNYFDAVLNLFTSFGYFDTDLEHERVLRNVYGSLKPGGLFLLDFFNAQWVRQHLVRQEEKKINGLVFRIHRSIRAGRVYKRVEFCADGRAYFFRERVRLFELADFQHMFECVGLRLLHTYGGYDLRPFEADTSERLILVAQKPPAL
ncbi:MAG: class I SAM-dependent methyltransferase [Saprospiraceae bacterium]|nr:class I SAM-dependent methyltransferase [Saprospiraceae bacterium]MDW8485272.1 class I SAM-dependent methyltransferase [Saprospiraceae bacterium]